MADRGMGYVPDPENAESFVATLPHPTLASAGPDLRAAGEDVMLYPALLACDSKWKRGSQGSVGSCVGWGSSLAVDVLAACDIHWRKEPEAWKGRTIESSLYGFSRVEARGIRANTGGDGSTGFHAAKAIRDFGSLHYGVDYGGTVIREEGKQARDREWGRNGVPDVLEPFAKERRCSETTLATSFDDCARAISNGFGVVFCSGQGFSMSRDEDGFCRAGGVWWHCLFGGGVRFGKRPGVLIFNSWGDSNTVGKHYPHDMPEAVRNCSFWADADVIDRMCAGRDSYVYAGFSGFKPTQLPDNWLRGIL